MTTSRIAGHTRQPHLTRHTLYGLVVAALLQATHLAAGTDIVTEVYPINFEHALTGICFHQGNMYTMTKSNILLKYNPDTGEILEIVEPLIPDVDHVHTHGLAVAPGDTFYTYDTMSQTLFQFRFLDYELIAVMNVPPAGPGHPPFGLTMLDQMLWLGYHSSGPPTPIHALDPESGEFQEQFEIGAADVHGLAWVGGTLWVLDNWTNTIHRVDASGAVLDSFVLPFDTWGSFAFDGTHFWTSNFSTFFHVNLPLSATGDLNGDGQVGADDLALLLGHWGPCPNCAADLDGDAQVNAADLAILLGNWG